MRHFPVDNDEVSFVVPGFIGSYVVQLYKLDKIKDNEAICVPFGNSLRFRITQEHSTIRHPKNIHRSIKKLEVMRTLNTIAIRNNNDFKSLKIPTLQKQPVWWWQSPEHDRLLLDTVFKLGSDCTQIMFTDRNCSFFSKDFEEDLKSKRKKLLKESKKTRDEFPIVPSGSELKAYLFKLVSALNE